MPRGLGVFLAIGVKRTDGGPPPEEDLVLTVTNEFPDARFSWSGYDANAADPDGFFRILLNGADDLGVYPVATETEYLYTDFGDNSPYTYKLQFMNQAGTVVLKESNVFGPIAIEPLLTMATVVSDNLMSRIGTSQDQQIFTSINHGTSTYVRNNSNFSQVDLTSHAVWNSRTARAGGLAVSTRTYLCNAHNGSYPFVGDTIRWVAADGTVVSRVVESQAAISGTDFMLSFWTTPLPGTINIVKILPSNYLDYLPNYLTTKLLGIYIDKNSKIVVGDTKMESFGHMHVFGYEPTDLDALALFELPESGDSSAPIGLLFPDEFVAVGSMHYGDSGSFEFAGSSIPDYITEINSAMTSAVGQQLSIFDASGYQTF